MGGWIGETFRSVKIVGRGGVTLVEDGVITEGFIHVPGETGGFKIKVTKNKAGGPATVEVTNDFRKELARDIGGPYKESEVIVMKKGHAYMSGIDAAFEAV